MRFALDIGGTFVKCASVSEDGRIVRAGEFPSDPNLDTDGFARELVAGARAFLKVGCEDVVSVGAGMAGFVDGNRGIVFESPNLPRIRELDLARVLREGLSLPAYVDNDATVAAWGEYLFGGHEGVEDLLAVTLGTGIGGGLVLGGRLYRGAGGLAGEIGQMPLYPDGPACPGGGKGCLEHYIGKTGLEEDYRIRAGLTEAVEPRIIHDRAESGDPAARDAWIAYGRRLGIVLASVSNLLDLGAIVLTGGIIGAWADFETALNEAFNTYLITPHKNRLPIRKSILEGRSGILGAAFLDRALERE